MRLSGKLFILIVLMLFGCKTQNNTSTATAGKTTMLYSGHFKKPVTDKELFKETTEVIFIDTAYTSGDSLNIITKKITGCDADNFRLMWDGIFSTDKPTKTTLKLFQALDPACKSKTQFHLIFNIKPLRSKADSAVSKSILIRFGTYRDVVKYSY